MNPPALSEGQSGEWAVRPASKRAAKEWREAAQQEAELMDAVRERLRTRPLDRRDNPRRLGKLKGSYANRRIGDKSLEQWQYEQYELTGAGRLWFCPDKDVRVVWVTKVSLSHPKETE